ncbi:MAG: ADP-ribosylglycohydrolase family protein [Spirochaetales bacterium]|nr:ADP-ribosylglycohydrolase family protein [Spirochaetales bacterium]
MLGAIIGDIAGSAYEHRKVESYDFPLFQRRSCITDDSVLTIGVAGAILEVRKKKDFSRSKEYYLQYIRLYGRRYPDAGYGHSFMGWLKSDKPKPYYSYGNGSGMRVSPVGLAFETMKDVLSEAKKTAEITHNHSDGIKGAQAVAGSVFLAKGGATKKEIRDFVVNKIGYPLDFDLETLRKKYRFEIQCAHSVPQAIFAFLQSNDFEDAVRKAVYIGGDSDTIACMAGAIAAAFYKSIPVDIKTKALFYLDAEQKKVMSTFNGMFHTDW